MFHCPWHLQITTCYQMCDPFWMFSFVSICLSRGVLVLLTFWHFSSELTETWISGATESGVWKSTEHKLHKIWRSVKFCQLSAKTSTPQRNSSCDNFVPFKTCLNLFECSNERSSCLKSTESHARLPDIYHPLIALVQFLPVLKISLNSTKTSFRQLATVSKQALIADCGN